MFDPEGGSNRAGRQNPRKPSNDDPIILNVETDGGDGPQPSSNVPPKRPSGPRITSKPNRPRKPSNGSKIFIGVVLALAIVIGLFFALAQFVTDVMWYSQLGFQSVIWTLAGHQGRPLAGVRGCSSPQSASSPPRWRYGRVPTLRTAPPSA